jgi:hypothetical protein
VNNYLAGGRKMKKVLLTIAAVVSVFALAGTAFATVDINVTSEPIRADATCDKAGGFTLTFGPDEVLLDGDQITFDLTYGVTLCRDIDIVLAAAAGATLTADATNVGWDAATTAQVGVDTPSPVSWENTAPTANAGGVYFHIYGTSGSPRITIDVIGEQDATSSLTVNGAPDDKLIVKFLDQRINTDFTTPGIYVDDSAVAGNNYTVAAAVADNTICIDVSDPDFTGTTVNANFDSKDDKYTFVPSNPQVAHLGPSLDYQRAYCDKGVAVGRIELGERTAATQTTGASETCTWFDFETGHGYCTGTHGDSNMLLIESLDAAYELINYQIVLEILVNGDPAYQGVAWSNQVVGADGFNTVADACADADGDPDVGAQANYTYYRSDGVAIPAGNVEDPHNNECDIGDGTAGSTDARAVSLETEASMLDLVASNDVLRIDIPAMNYDLDLVAQDDEVTVAVTLLKTPCGVLYTDEIEVGTIGCVVIPVTQTSKLLFPYFTPVEADDAWWDGVAIINLTSTDGTVTLTFYEMDGDIGSTTVDLPAGGMFLSTLADLLAGMTLDTSVDGTLGNSDCYVKALASGPNSIDGFAMMGYSDGGWGIGYLPRTNY